MKKVLSVLAGAVLLFGSAGVALAYTPLDYTFELIDTVNGAISSNVPAPMYPDNGDFFFTDPTTGMGGFLGLDTSNGLTINGSNQLSLGMINDTKIADVDYGGNIEGTIVALSNATSSLQSQINSNNSSISSLSSTVSSLYATSNLTLAGIKAFMADQATTSQLIATSTFNGFMSGAMVTKLNGLSATTSLAYEGTTARLNSFPIFKSATVSSGTAVFNMTTDGTSGATSLCPNGVIQDSVNPSVNDATASYQMSWAWSNSNKTLTVTANKLTTSNILTGILGQVAANAAVVKVSIWCY